MNLRNILSAIGGAFTQDDEEIRRLPPMEELRRQQALRALQRRDRDDIGTRQSNRLFSDKQRARRDELAKHRAEQRARRDKSAAANQEREREGAEAEKKILQLQDEMSKDQRRTTTDDELRLDEEIANTEEQIGELQKQLDEPGMFGDRNTSKDPIKMEETVTTDTAPKKSDGFLSRLGRNPELLAQIAQLGGGLISGMAQDKAQRRADATTQDRMARANLIGALTGRRPGVAEERADTGGFFSLDTLGKAIKGGGALAQDEIQRREAREQQEILNKIAMAKATGKGSGGAAGRRTVAEMDASLAVIDDSLSQLEKFFEEGGGEGADSLERMEMIFQGFMTRVPFLGAWINPEKQSYTDMRGSLVGEIAKMIAGGRTSDLETRMAEEIVPDLRNPRDTGKFGVDKMRHLKRILTMRRDAMAQGLDDKNLYKDLYAIFGKGYNLPEPGSELADRLLTKEELEKEMVSTQEEIDETQKELDELGDKKEFETVKNYLDRQGPDVWIKIEAAQANPGGPEYQELMKDPTIAKFLEPGA